MRWHEFSDKPVGLEADLLDRVKPEKIKEPRVEYQQTKPYEIRYDGTGGRTKAVTLKSLHAHRQYLERKAAEKREKAPFIVAIYGNKGADCKAPLNPKGSNGKSQKTNIERMKRRIEKQIDKRIAQRRTNEKRALRARLNDEKAKYKPS